MGMVPSPTHLISPCTGMGASLANPQYAVLNFYSDTVESL